jgi:hypothetical protein
MKKNFAAQNARAKMFINLFLCLASPELKRKLVPVLVVTAQQRTAVPVSRRR